MSHVCEWPKWGTMPSYFGPAFSGRDKPGHRFQSRQTFVAATEIGNQVEIAAHLQRFYRPWTSTRSHSGRRKNHTILGARAVRSRWPGFAHMWALFGGEQPGPRPLGRGKPCPPRHDRRHQFRFFAKYMGGHPWRCQSPDEGGRIGGSGGAAYLLENILPFSGAVTPLMLVPFFFFSFFRYVVESR